jgi:ketosteroid isomerase-like protein
MYARTVSDVELLRSVFDGWGQGDFSRGMEVYADDVYFTTAEPEGRHDGRGPDGVRRWMKQFLGAWEHYAVRVDEIEELGGGRYHGAGEQYARGKQSATETRMPAHVGARVEDGKITRLVFGFSREEAVARLDE